MEWAAGCIKKPSSQVGVTFSDERYSDSMTELERIEVLHQQYLSLRENTPMMERDGEECRAYHEWYDAAYVYFRSVDYLQEDPDLTVFVDAKKEGNCFVLEHIYDSISPSYKVLMLKARNKAIAGTTVTATKMSKIFISHCGGDKDAVISLVDLLGEIINLSSENLFCSSAPGFDVMLGDNFMDNIWEQYNNNQNLFLLYVLSHNYMNSPMCLNEMGASWITKKDSIGILLPGFDINDLGNSCYDKRSISVIFNQDDKEVRHRLNQLKEKVEQLFPGDKKNIHQSRWEEKRDGFIAIVRSLPVAKKDGFEKVHVLEETDVKPKASIVSSVSYKGKGSYVITFSNKGDSSAEDLFVEFEDVEGIFVLFEKGLFPIEILKPGRSFQINAMMTEGAPHKMMSQVKWKEADTPFEEKELILFNK